MWAVVLLILFAASPVRAAAPEELSFCRFGPKMRVLQPVRGGKPCEASARIQGLLWECVAPDQVAGRVESFRKKLVQEATGECEKFCRGEGRSCAAKFTVPERCGLETDQEEAVAAGKKFGCRGDCGGKAFSYCSLYDAGYHLSDPAKVPNQPPNCLCSAAK